MISRNNWVMDISTIKSRLGLFKMQIKRVIVQSSEFAQPVFYIFPVTLNPIFVGFCISEFIDFMV